MNRHDRRARTRLEVASNRHRSGLREMVVPESMRRDYPACENIRSFWVNDRFSVQVYQRAELVHLIIRRHDQRAVHAWTELLEVVHELYPGRWAFEVYPPAGEVVDEANLYHLWVMPEGVSPAPAVIAEGEPFGDPR